MVKKQTIFDRKVLDSDLLQLCELCGPRASQPPTLFIFCLRSIWHKRLYSPVRQVKNARNKTLFFRFLMTAYGQILKSIDIIAVFSTPADHNQNPADHNQNEEWSN